MNNLLTTRFKLHHGLLMSSQRFCLFPAPYLDTLQHAINDFLDKPLAIYSLLKQAESLSNAGTS